MQPLIFRPGELRIQTSVVRDGPLFRVVFVAAPGTSLEMDDGKRRRPITLAEYKARLRYLGDHGHLRYEVDGGHTREERAAYKAELEKPGRPPVNFHSEWAARFRELKTAEEAYESPVEGERKLNKFELCFLVACDDYASHPGRWKYDPEANHDRAAARVWQAVKPLI
jgi:hypothetical protein